MQAILEPKGSVMWMLPSLGAMELKLAAVSLQERNTVNAMRIFHQNALTPYMYK